jgi:hypothetical protein
MVSKSGVHGSRYGFVVFMKVTRQCESTTTVEYKKEHTISWDVHPDSVIVEGVLVRIEALQGFIEALCWWRKTIPELGIHSLDALVHCEHIGFFSSHFSFRCLQVRLQKVLVAVRD